MSVNYKNPLRGDGTKKHLCFKKDFKCCAAYQINDPDFQSPI